MGIRNGRLKFSVIFNGFLVYEAYMNRNQTYISYIEDTHQILFGSANFGKVHVRTARQPDRQTDGIFFCLFCLLRHTKHEHS